MHLKRVVTPRIRRLKALRELVSEAALAHGREQDRLLLCFVVELANLWAEFCKSYVLCCASGATSLAGSRWKTAIPSLTNTEKIRIFLVQNVRGIRNPNPLNPMHEPDWKDLTVVFDCCNALGLMNLGAIRTAAGLGLSFLDELASARNFAAHKSKLARHKLDAIALSRGLSVKSDLRGIVLAPGSGGRGSVGLEWVTEVENGIVFMCS